MDGEVNFNNILPNISYNVPGLCDVASEPPPKCTSPCSKAHVIR